VLFKLLDYIRQHPGVTAAILADIFGDATDTRYGAYKRVSWHIAELRRLHLIHDCSRCPTCHQATTRRLRNVPLFAATV
jgi:hypothetical protein